MNFLECRYPFPCLILFPYVIAHYRLKHGQANCSGSDWKRSSIKVIARPVWPDGSRNRNFGLNPNSRQCTVIDASNNPIFQWLARMVCVVQTLNSPRSTTEGV